MCSRRNKPVLQAVVFLGLVGCLGYFVYLYNTKSLKLERTDRQLKKYIQHQQSLSSQLKVVYEHRALLEKSFEKEKIDHKKTMQDLANTKREFSRNITRTKHETLNRFNSLETQHRMVKAQHEQIQLEYNRLQQQHARLSAEHQSVHNQQRNAFNIMKTQKQNEILALEDQLSTLKKQVQSWRVEYGNQKQETDYYKGRISEHVKEAENNKAIIRSLYDNINQLQRRLSSSQQQERNVGRSHDQVKPSEQSNQHVNQRKGIGRPGRPAVHNVIPTITKNTIQRSPNKGNDVKSDDDETEDKDSEEDENRQQNGVQPKAAVAAPVNNDQASRRSNETPVILQATQPSVTTSKIEAEDSDEAERKKVERYLTRNEENMAKQQQRQQQRQQQQQQEQEQQQRLQQQRQRQQLLQKQQQQQQLQQHQQQQQQQRQQQQKHEGLYQNLQQEQQSQNSREMYQRLQQLQQQQRHQQQPQQRGQQHQYQPHQPQQRKSDERSDNTRQERRPNEPGHQKERTYDNDDSKETNSQEQRSQTGDKQKREIVKQAEEKRGERFRRPIGRPGGREADARNQAEKESQNRDDKREEQPAQEENNEEEEEEDDNENDERDNTINQGQENQEKTQEVKNRQNQPDDRQKDGVNPHIRGLRHA